MKNREQEIKEAVEKLKKEANGELKNGMWTNIYDAHKEAETLTKMTGLPHYIKRIGNGMDVQYIARQAE